MKNFDEFSNSIRINESEIKFLNEDETELNQLGIELTNYMEDQGIKFPAFDIKNGVLTLDMAGEEIHIKPERQEYSTGHGTHPGYVVSMKHNPDEKVEDIFGWLARHVSAYQHGEGEYHHETWVEKMRDKFASQAGMDEGIGLLPDEGPFKGKTPAERVKNYAKTLNKNKVDRKDAEDFNTLLGMIAKKDSAAQDFFWNLDTSVRDTFASAYINRADGKILDMDAKKELSSLLKVSISK